MTPRADEFLQAISNASLFAHVGEALPVAPAAAGAVRVRSWSQALQSCAGATWSEVQLAARGELTSFLAHQHRARYRGWNDITKNIRPRVLELVTPICEALTLREKLLSSPLASVSWDVLAACMEYEYADLKPPAFYDRVASLYLLGRFPCGFRGEYPLGRIKLF